LKKALVKFSIIMCILLPAAIWGCGVKNNPVVLKNYSGNTQVVRNLKVTASDHSVLLKRDVLAHALNYHDIELKKIHGTPKVIIAKFI
jgi:hypothetical protein